MDQEDVVVKTIDCRKCQFHGTAYEAVLCCRGAIAVPCETARDYRSECGPNAKFFIPIKVKK